MRFAFALSLALCACAAPVSMPDAATDDRPSFDATDGRVVDVIDAQPDTIDDRSSIPTDTGIDTGVAPRDTGVGDTGLPPCTLDPRNCGMCGRVCGEGALTSRPACAEVATGRWDCVNNCSGFGEGCRTEGGGRVCCASGCGPGLVGCR